MLLSFKNEIVPLSYLTFTSEVGREQLLRSCRSRQNPCSFSLLLQTPNFHLQEITTTIDTKIINNEFSPLSCPWSLKEWFLWDRRPGWRRWTRRSGRGTWACTSCTGRRRRPSQTRRRSRCRRSRSSRSWPAPSVSTCSRGPWPPRSVCTGQQMILSITTLEIFWILKFEMKTEYQETFQ